MIIEIRPKSPLRTVERRIIGLNTNFLTDHADIRSIGRGYENALRQMGVKSLRYPGGEKSDEFFWSEPPWDSPRPTLALTGPGGRLSPLTDYIENYTGFRHKPLDFDEFNGLCQALNAEPVVCVNFDSMYLPPVSEKGIAPTKAQLLEHAVEWVRYANLRRGYRVKYWELGNESYLLGHNGAAKAFDYAKDFVDFGRSMKAVDPSILVGANGHVHKDSRGQADGEDGPIWWQTLLEIAAPEIDFLVVHPYPCWMWGSYDYYLTHNVNFTDAVDQACAALVEWAPAEHASRIRVLVTETNAADWAGSEHFPGLKGWPLVNDLGHALVLFEILGQHLLHPRVDAAQVWNTRWVHPTSKELWNTLDENNEFNATGHAIAIWGQNLKATMVAASSSDLVRAFASYDPDAEELAIFLINKDRQAQPVEIILKDYVANWDASRCLLHGQGPEDQQPFFEENVAVSGEGQGLSIDLEPVSISAITLIPR